MKTFNQRVNYAAACLKARSRKPELVSNNRRFDDCFENFDGSYVVTALVRMAASDPELKASLFASWDSVAKQFDQLDDAQLRSEARKRRRAALRESRKN